MADFSGIDKDPFWIALSIFGGVISAYHVLIVNLGIESGFEIMIGKTDD